LRGFYPGVPRAGFAWYHVVDSNGESNSDGQQNRGISLKLKLWILWTAAILLSLTVVYCTTDYVTGKRTFSLVSESQEIEMGRDADPQIVAEYGLYDDFELQAYVNDIGQNIAKVSHRSNLDYTVRVVDTPVVNAFALPGGYVYITRGILAHFNSEDELAGVMGHEIGHVVARHSAEQMSRAQLAGLGLQLGSVVSETFARYAQFAGVGVGLLFLRFSRDQESESDMLGVEYSTKLGYDANNMADFFRTLESMQEQSGQSLPSFLSTHPDPGDREVKVHALADEWQGKISYQPLAKDRYDYLRRIDGIVYGADPRQGYVENDRFYHPQLQFVFPVPSGWEVNNSASTVFVIEPEQKAFVQLTLNKAEAAESAADEFLANSGAAAMVRRTKKVHGFDAVVVESSLEAESGTLRLLSYFIRKAPNVYIFHGVTTTEVYGTYSGTLATVMEGFRGVTDASVLNKQPRRLGIERAPQSGTVRQALLALGTGEDSVDELALLNGKGPNDRVAKGEWLKVVRD
jgi:predicted Zn-dependent protease